MADKQTLEKTKGEIKNEQSKVTGNIGYTTHSMKTNKRKNTTQKAKKMGNTDPTKNWG
jgi:hypothetical protein